MFRLPPQLLQQLGQIRQPMPLGSPQGLPFLPGRFPPKQPGTFGPQPFEGGIGGFGRGKRKVGMPGLGAGIGGLGGAAKGFPRRALY